MKILPLNTFLEIGKNLEPGEQVHVHHCREGQNNDRLYIKKTHDGKILAYCHHCGGRATYITNDFKLPHEQKCLKKKQEIILPYINYKQKEWPDEAVIWLSKARIQCQYIKIYGIGYIPLEQRIFLPIKRGDKLIAYQTRRIFKWDKGPKYLTTHLLRFDKIYMVIADKYRKPHLTIVEDLLSGIRVSKFTDVIVLFGSNFYEELHRLVIPYDKVFIFLDDDNAQIQMKQVEIRDTIDFYNHNVWIVKGQKSDPKNLSDEELRRLLC